MSELIGMEGKYIWEDGLMRSCSTPSKRLSITHLFWNAQFFWPFVICRYTTPKINMALRPQHGDIGNVRNALGFSG